MADLSQQNAPQPQPQMQPQQQGDGTGNPANPDDSAAVYAFIAVCFDFVYTGVCSSLMRVSFLFFFCTGGVERRDSTVNDEAWFSAGGLVAIWAGQNDICSS